MALNITGGGTIVGKSPQASGAITIPDTVTIIASMAFFSSKTITGVTLPVSVNSIRTAAFAGCIYLTSVTILGPVSKIDDSTFFGCSKLTSIMIPSSVTSINKSAFGESGLTSITIPASVTSIGDYAFTDCVKLERIEFLGTTCNVSSISFAQSQGKVPIPLCIVPSGWTGPNSFAGVTRVIPRRSAPTNLIIETKTPNSLTFTFTAPADKNGFGGIAGYEITNYEYSTNGGTTYTAFNPPVTTSPITITDLTPDTPYSVTLRAVNFAGEGDASDTLSTRTMFSPGTITVTVQNPAGITLSTIEVPTGGLLGDLAATLAEERAAAAANGQTQDSVTEAATGNKLAPSAQVSSDVTVKLSFRYIYSVVGGLLDSINGPPLTNAVIPSTVTTIGANLFFGAYDLETAVLPSTLTTVGSNAFTNCFSLKTLTFPANSSLATIGPSAFISCTSLNEIVFPEGVTTIGAEAFTNCTGLQSVTFPASLTTIGDAAFYYCPNLVSITFLGTGAGLTVAANAFLSCGTGVFKALNWSGSQTVGVLVFRADRGRAMDQATDSFTVTDNINGTPTTTTYTLAKAVSGQSNNIPITGATGTVSVDMTAASTTTAGAPVTAVAMNVTPRTDGGYTIEFTAKNAAGDVVSEGLHIPIRIPRSLGAPLTVSVYHTNRTVAPVTVECLGEAIASSSTATYYEFVLTKNDFVSVVPPTGLAASNIKGTMATLSWTPSAIDQAAVQAANHEYSFDDGVTWAAFSPEVTESPATLVGLTPSTLYSVKIRAVAADLVTTGAPTTATSFTTRQDDLPCFPTGVRILTPAGYRTVETLRSGDLVQTADGRSVAITKYETTVPAVSARTAPYLIPAHTFGRNSPPADLRLSPLHAFQIKKGVWQIPRFANNSRATQYGIGEAVTYYHLECPNFLRDNLVAEGCVVESFAGKQIPAGITVYTPSRRLDGYTRITSIHKPTTKV